MQAKELLKKWNYNGPLIRKATHSSVSNPPQILKIRGPFTGSLNSLEALSPKMDSIRKCT
jgi:hypothetical protein